MQLPHAIFNNKCNNNNYACEVCNISSEWMKF